MLLINFACILRGGELEGKRVKRGMAVLYGAQKLKEKRGYSLFRPHRVVVVRQ
jgi:hypothetical protein